jgi:hypothetical protein
MWTAKFVRDKNNEQQGEATATWTDGVTVFRFKGTITVDGVEAFAAHANAALAAYRTELSGLTEMSATLTTALNGGD